MNPALKLISRSFLLSRNITAYKTAVRSHIHYVGGIPGENMPFAFHNRFTLTLKFIIFFGSGFWAPFIVVSYQLLK